MQSKASRWLTCVDAITLVREKVHDCKTQLSCHLSSGRECTVQGLSQLLDSVCERKRMRSRYGRDNPHKAFLFRPKSGDITLPISDFNWLSHITVTPA